MISRQEHEAWEVLLACQGQLRLAPSGHVIGIDMDAALKIGAARGSDLAVLSELLPAAEAGLVEALCSDGIRDEVRRSGTSGSTHMCDFRLGRGTCRSAYLRSSKIHPSQRSVERRRHPWGVVAA